jgi:hypothetical protein
MAGTATVEHPRVPDPLGHHHQQETSQSDRAPSVNSLPLGNTLRVATVVQQIMTEFNGAVPEEAKTVAIRKTVLNLTKQNDHQSSKALQSHNI